LEDSRRQALRNPNLLGHKMKHTEQPSLTMAEQMRFARQLSKLTQIPERPVPKFSVFCWALTLHYKAHCLIELAVQKTVASKSRTHIQHLSLANASYALLRIIN